MSPAADAPVRPVPPPREGTRTLAAELGPRCGGRVSFSDLDRLACARDMWPRWLIYEREGLWPRPPDLVASPASVGEAQAVLAACAKAGVPVVPYGAGSGVCGGTLCTQGGVALDLKLLSRVRRIDPERRTVTVEAGHLGWTLEEKLARAGWTAGHFPSSMSCSTVGGWVAARGAGQLSTRYGKIEDICLGLEALRFSGERIEAEADLGQSPWVDLLAGSEGTLAVVTAATLRLWSAPERRRFSAWRFTGVEPGLAALREVLRAGLRPAVVRLYDPLDTLLASGGDSGGPSGGRKSPAAASFNPWLRAAGRRLGFPALGLALRASWTITRAVDLFARRGCRLVLIFEGAPALCDAEARAAEPILRRHGAAALGEEPAEHWWRHRYDISFRQAPVFAAGLWVDTMELSATWDRLPVLYRSVRRALAPYAVCMAHFSHAYADGCSVYLTFIGGGGSAEEAAARHRDAWAAGLTAALAEGVAVSHHHGVGLAKADAYQKQLGPGGQRLLSALHGALDPRGLLNPGKLGLRPPPPAPVHVRAARTARRRFRPSSREELVAWLRSQAAEGGADLSAIDGSAFDTLGPIGEDALFVEAGAGRKLAGIESRLRTRGLTLGLLPPSVLAGTVADWLEGPHRGLRASPSGLLETAALSLEALLPDGTIFRSPPVPRSAAGPGLVSLVLGGEGRCARLVSAALRVAPSAAARRRVALRARSAAPLLETLRAGLSAGAIPAAAGLWRDGREVVLAAAYDGPGAVTEAGAETVLAEAGKRALAPGCAADGQHWWSGRAGAAGLEVACSWPDMAALFSRWSGRFEFYRITHEGAVVVGLPQRAVKGSRFRKLHPRPSRPARDPLFDGVARSLRAPGGRP